ncbi:MAG: cytidine deaminase [Hominisplanchenecus sp.]|nr:cytidine deaminase [Lachnospiraceae bacterium]MDY2819104.1 cytidine deaminase [Hominisplanchenecus sp.]
MTRETEEMLVREAYAAQERAYAPYSHFMVGAALLAENGRIYRGCNIENAAYSVSNCAERTAFFKAISEGERNFTAIAIAGNLEGKPGDYCPPCGVCRQMMSEFCGKDFIILMARSLTDWKTCTLGELLPESFSL